MKQEEIVLDADIQNLARLNDWLDAFMALAAISSRERSQLEVAVEEIFVNIASYAYAPQTGQVVVAGKVTEDPAAIELIFMDAGRPFDPLARDDPATDVDLKDREIGGWGIFLVKKIMDEVSYRREDGKNILALRKTLLPPES